MKKSNKWVRPVSFNCENEMDQRRLELVGKKAFSTFVKKLMDETCLLLFQTTNVMITPF